MSRARVSTLCNIYIFVCIYSFLPPFEVGKSTCSNHRQVQRDLGQVALKYLRCLLNLVILGGVQLYVFGQIRGVFGVASRHVLSGGV